MKGFSRGERKASKPNTPYADQTKQLSSRKERPASVFSSRKPMRGAYVAVRGVAFGPWCAHFDGA